MSFSATFPQAIPYPRSGDGDDNSTAARGPGFQQGLPSTAGGRPLFILAPLAGVSDHPFRRLCQEWGADLTYVEMLSATALLYQNKKTYDMAIRHEAEPILGVQLTGKDPDDVARAVEILDRGPYDTIDLNMGCPVTKVVGAGCGSALLKNPETVAKMILLARQATGKPLSVKIRLGWDRSHLSGPQQVGVEPPVPKKAPLGEILDAVEQGGAAWVTIHGRYRSDDYSVPVDLAALETAKKRLKIPVIGNGNLFSWRDVKRMGEESGVDGFMISRGALGQPWIFGELKASPEDVSSLILTLDDWESTVFRHLEYQKDAYGDTHQSAVVMRKHLLWYTTGWPGARKLRDTMAKVSSLGEASRLISQLVAELRAQGCTHRSLGQDGGSSETSRKFVGRQQVEKAGDAVLQSRVNPEVVPMRLTTGPTEPMEFASGKARWDPKGEMDRELDRGVGALGLSTPL